MDTKKWYQSKAIWAGIVTALVGAAEGIARAVGVDLRHWYRITVIFYSSFSQKLASCKSQEV